MFSVLPASLISSTYTDKNSPFSQLTNKHSQFKTFPNRVPIELFRIAVPIIVLPKDYRTDSAQEEQLGLPHCTITFAICALVDVSLYLDILTLECLNNDGASSILTWVQADVASAASAGQSGSLAMTSITFAAVACEADDLCSVKYCIRT